MHNGFANIWGELKSKSWAYALRSVSYHDAEDLVSAFSLYVWGVLGSGKFDNRPRSHIVGFMVRYFKHRVIDFVRKRNRETLKIRKLEVVHPQYAVDSKLLLNEVRGIVNGIDVEDGIKRCLLEGFSVNEIAKATGICKATVSRRVTFIRAELKRQLCGSRLVAEVILKGGYKMQVRKTEEGKLEVVHGDEVVAMATVDGLNIRSIVLNAKEGDKGKILEAIRKAVVKDHKSPTKKKVAKVKKTDIPEAEAKPTKKKVIKKVMANKKEIEIEVEAKTTKKKVVKKKEPVAVGRSLKAHIKKCGGPGKCLCGCGANVSRNFAPGHDMRLKSALKAKGNDAAKNLAKDFGWDKIIKWAK